MRSIETCWICGTGQAVELVAWFVAGEHRAVHTDCWIAAHEPEVDLSRLSEFCRQH